MQDTEPKRTRTPGSGRRPAGPNGEPRDQLLAVKVATAERETVYDMLRRKGYEPGPAGVRAFLLEVAEQHQVAEQHAA